MKMSTRPLCDVYSRKIGMSSATPLGVPISFEHLRLDHLKARSGPSTDRWWDFVHGLIEPPT